MESKCEKDEKSGGEKGSRRRSGKGEEGGIEEKIDLRRIRKVETKRRRVERVGRIGKVGRIGRIGNGEERRERELDLRRKEKTPLTQR